MTHSPIEISKSLSQTLAATDKQFAHAFQCINKCDYTVI